jgi:hypothetical protein
LLRTDFFPIGNFISQNSSISNIFESSILGFYDECKRRYNVKLWKTFTDCFNCLPIAAIIDEKIFCCHGGLSPDLHVSCYSIRFTTVASCDTYAQSFSCSQRSLIFFLFYFRSQFTCWLLCLCLCCL